MLALLLADVIASRNVTRPSTAIVSPVPVTVIVAASTPRDGRMKNVRTPAIKSLTRYLSEFLPFHCDTHFRMMFFIRQIPLFHLGLLPGRILRPLRSLAQVFPHN